MALALALAGSTLAGRGAPAQESESAGGPIQTYAIKTSRESHTLGEKLNYVRLPGANVAFHTAGLPTSDFVVTFTGVCRLFGASADDWIAIQLTLDGIVPLKPTEGIAPFCSDDNYGSHSVTAFETDVLPGDHTVEARWRIIDGAPDGDLLAEIGPWSLLVFVRN
jgi:hypothetical protein